LGVDIQDDLEQICLPPLRAKAISIHLCGQATLLFSPSSVEIWSYFLARSLSLIAASSKQAAG